MKTSSHFLFDPFDLMRSFLNQSRWASPWAAVNGRTDGGEWAPQIESFQRGNEFVVRADLPGLEQKDISVQLKDDPISGSSKKRGITGASARTGASAA